MWGKWSKNEKNEVMWKKWLRVNSVKIVLFVIIFFFFSSRRRHTRYWRDWSSDVCSSDLSRLSPLLVFKTFWRSVHCFTDYLLLENTHDKETLKNRLVVTHKAINHVNKHQKRICFEIMKANHVIRLKNDNLFFPQVSKVMNPANWTCPSFVEFASWRK